MHDVITLGEPLIRFEPYNQYGRLERTDHSKWSLGGAEANVAAALANVGKLETALITKLPTNPLGRWVEHCLDSYNVDTKLIAHGGPRVGTYYSEQGARPRIASVTYDREHSSFSESCFEDYQINYSRNPKIFFTSGITLALNENTRNVALKLIKNFKESGSLIAFDVNYRSNLWSEEEAKTNIEKLLPYIDILFISEVTCRKMFKRTGTLEAILQDFAKTYDIKIIATTQREVIDQSHHRFSSIIYDSSLNRFFKSAKPYDIEVVDRVGSGDAYIAGTLYGLLTNNFNCATAQEYGDAFSALKCTITGDILDSNLDEINDSIKKHQKGIVGDIKR